MRHASAPSASVLLVILAATVAGCGTREPTPATDTVRAAARSTVADRTVADSAPRAEQDPSPEDAGWPGRAGSIRALVATAEGEVEVELRAAHEGRETDDGVGTDGRDVGSETVARVGSRHDSRLRFEPVAHASALLPEFRVLDRIEWAAGRATRHLTVEGWRPGVEVAVRIPHELLAREARLLVHGAPFTVEPGTHAFDLPLSRDETTILEWTPREPARSPR